MWQGLPRIIGQFQAAAHDSCNVLAARGSEGIQSHFDDDGRFDRPIYSLRLFSDSRLSFGTQLYGCALHIATGLVASFALLL